MTNKKQDREDDDYEPFGAEWEKEVTKLTKKEIIAILRCQLINSRREQ